MLDGLRSWWRTVLVRARRVERRELREFRAWLETTRNLVHVSLLVILPAVLGLVTFVSNVVATLPFLLFPPLASGSYTLFAHPEGKYASPTRFVGGLTSGGFCGWLALETAARYWYRVPPNDFQIHAGAVALGIFLTGVVTWTLDIEEASAYSTALLIHLVDVTNTAPVAIPVTGSFRFVVGPGLLYVVSVFVSTSIVAAVFVVWRSRVYERRARFLYATTKGDDHVLVPMRGDHREATAMLGASLAAAHDAGKVVLLDVVDDEAIARAEHAMLEASDPAADVPTNDGSAGRVRRTDRAGGSSRSGPAGRAVRPGYATIAETNAETIPEAVSEAIDEAGDDDAGEDTGDMAKKRAAVEAATELERTAHRIETRTGVPCQVVVAIGGTDRAGTVLGTVRETNCDLVVTPYEERHGQLSRFVRDLFRGEVDVLVHRSVDGRTEWREVLVPVRKASDVAHGMIDFATRLARSTGRVAVCHCLESSGNRREAEEMLANLVETYSGTIETRISRSSIETFLSNNAGQYDLTIIGASTDRTTASRFISPPTFQRIQSLDCDVALLHRGW